MKVKHFIRFHSGSHHVGVCGAVYEKFYFNKYAIEG